MEPAPLTLSSFFANLFAFFGLSGDATVSSVGHLATTLWLWIIVLGYLASAAGLVVLVWALMRLFDLRKREEEFYTTPLTAPERAHGGSPRWQHIEALVAGRSPSEWREAIIEADIMLDDSLARRGYTGAGVGEKLMQVERTDLATLNDAWEAHKVRNQIAHEGSAFDISETLASRTIARRHLILGQRGTLRVMSKVIFADNLEVLRLMPSESVSLIYIDPPF